MHENLQAVAVGYNFGIIPAHELDGIDLKHVGAVRFEGENWNLVKAKTFADSRKIDVLLDKYGDHLIKDHEIKPIIMSGELEMVVPGFDKERDALLFGGYAFSCDERNVPFDFSGTSWSIDQEGDVLHIAFSTGKTNLLTDYFLDPCYEEDYKKIGLRINDITAEFLSHTTAITEFMVMTDINGKEFTPEELSKFGSFSIKSLVFDDLNHEYPVKKAVLDQYNSSLKSQEKASLTEQIQSASIRSASSEPSNKFPAQER